LHPASCLVPKHKSNVIQILDQIQHPQNQGKKQGAALSRLQSILGNILYSIAIKTTFEILDLVLQTRERINWN